MRLQGLQAAICKFHAKLKCAPEQLDVDAPDFDPAAPGSPPIRGPTASRGAALGKLRSFLLLVRLAVAQVLFSNFSCKLFELRLF
jgi:hypothetical protein